MDIGNRLLAAQNPGRLVKKLKRYARPDLLVLDEPGYLPIDKRGADLLFQIISGRYERGAIVLTTNKAFKHWPSISSNDGTRTLAILDRVLHHAETTSGLKTLLAWVPLAAYRSVRGFETASTIIGGKSDRMKTRIKSRAAGPSPAETHVRAGRLTA